MFIFNTKLLLIGIEGVFDLLLTILSAVTAILVFSAATQGFWYIKNRWWETILLLLIAFALFRPDFFWDELYPPTQDVPATELVTAIESMESGQFIELNVKGESFNGDAINKTVSLQLDQAEGSAAQRLQSMGLVLKDQGQSWIVDQVTFGSPAEKAGVSFGFNIDSIRQQAKRPPPELVFIPAILLLVLMGWLQKGRVRKQLSPA